MIKTEKIWHDLHCSVCSITFSAKGVRLSSGTGFKLLSYLITNNHVIQVPGAEEVTIRFVDDDGHRIKTEKTISYLSFMSRLQDGDPESQWDYAILSLDDNEFTAIPPLTLAHEPPLPIGAKIALLGFHFDQTNLSIHSGILSSKFFQNGVNYLQIDASVNQGNSGGPLIDPETLQVIGIVTRKLTGLTKQFNDLIKSFDEFLRTLEKASQFGSGEIMGVDVLGGFSLTQTQLKRVSLELHRSANVGVGFAYELTKLKASHLLR